MTYRYRLFGLTILSEIPLPADPETFSGEPRVRIARGTGHCGTPGEVLARYTVGDHTAYVLRQCTQGYHLEFPGRSTLRFSSDLRQVWVDPHPSVPLSWISHLLVGVVPATVLTLSGEWVLHASAVALSEGAVAFAGAMAAGKTTLAVALAREGARWVTDDLLRVLFQEDGPRCIPGPAWARVRQDLLQALPSEWPREPGPEGRTLVWIPRVSGTPRLRAVVFPEVTSDVREPVFEKLATDRAFPRVFEGVKLQALLASPFLQARMDFAARVVQQVPVYRLRVPRGLDGLLRTAQSLLQRLASWIEP